MALTFDVEPASYIQIDLFPAKIHPSDESHTEIGTELRAIVTDNYFYIFTDGGTGPEILVKEPLSSFDGSHKTGYTVVTETSTYFFRRSMSCGCGSRLRGLYPFVGVPHISQIKK